MKLLRDESIPPYPVPQIVVPPHESFFSNTYSFALKDGFVIDGQQSFLLMPFDEVYVRKSPGYIQQQNVTIEGEVMYAGAYTLSKKNERISDIFRKAGGATDLAFIEGARLERRVNEFVTVPPSWM